MGRKKGSPSWAGGVTPPLTYLEVMSIAASSEGTTALHCTIT